MGIESYSFNKLLTTIKDKRALGVEPRVLSFGVPDIFTDLEEFKPYQSKNKKLIEFHRGNVPCNGAKILRDHLKLDITFLEFKKMKDVNLVADLNTVQASTLYDIIIDPGTTEHIFNIANVYKFIVESLLIYGSILHSSPANRINHGFYSISPTLLQSVYDQNGFTIEDMILWTGPYVKLFTKDIKEKPHSRYATKVECNVVCHAVKTQHKAFTFPIQDKYK